MKNNIKLIREQRAMTQKECAEKLKITLRAWQTYEQGVSEPRHELLIKIADMLNVSIDYLLGRNVEEPNDFEQLARRVGMSETERAVFERYFTLPQDLRGGFMDCLIKMTDISG